MVKLLCMEIPMVGEVVKSLHCVHRVIGLTPGHDMLFTKAFFFLGLWGSSHELQSSCPVRCSRDAYVQSTYEETQSTIKLIL